MRFLCDFYALLSAILHVPAGIQHSVILSYDRKDARWEIMQNDGGITASGAFFDSVVAKSDFVISGYILSVIFQIVATVRLILSGLVVC